MTNHLLVMTIKNALDKILMKYSSQGIFTESNNFL